MRLVIILLLFLAGCGVTQPIIIVNPYSSTSDPYDWKDANDTATISHTDTTYIK